MAVLILKFVALRFRLAWLALLLFGVSAGVNAQSPSVRVAVLDFGISTTGARAAGKVREGLTLKSEAANGIALVDPDLAAVAARGAGYEGSLNLTTESARDLGSAIGCEFYFLGEAQTFRRSPSTGPAYFESFASIFLVSARTGQLIHWERPLLRRDSPEQAEQALLQVLGTAETRDRYVIAIRRALTDERMARQTALERPPPVIEAMADELKDEEQSVRPPRPYRRMKPAYPESAAVAEVEATVDVLVDVDSRGEVGQIEIARWAGYGLDQSVIGTVRQMHFFPALRDRVPVPMRVLLRYNFRKPPK
jgi:TonB family protein